MSTGLLKCVGSLLAVLAFSFSASPVQAQGKPASPPPAPWVAVTGLGFGSEVKPGMTINVATNSSVVRVEYSIGATGYLGLAENYLGDSKVAPFSFTWNGFASSLDLGSRLILVVRAFDNTDRVATVQLPVVVPGACGSGVSPAKNVARSAYWLVTNLNGASLAGISYNSAVRAVTRLDNVGEAGVFPVDAPVAGRYEITVSQYVLSGTKPNFSVAVNDAVVAPSLPGVKTATAWNNFGAADFNRAGTTTIVADLKAGSNKIKVQSLSGGVLNIGSVLVAQPGR